MKNLQLLDRELFLDKQLELLQRDTETLCDLMQAIRARVELISNLREVPKSLRLVND